MPFRRIGKVIQKKVDGKWTKKQTCSSAEKAKSALRILRDWESKRE